MATIPASLDALRVPVDSLKHYGRNPRRGDVAALVDSLEQNGQYRPIVVNARTQEVLAGNHTLKAARELGWDEIAATFVDADDDTAARIVLVDNRSNDIASYDDQELADLLESLPQLDGTGYDSSDLEDLLDKLDSAPASGGGGGGDGTAQDDDREVVVFRLDPDQKHELDRALETAKNLNPIPEGADMNAHALTVIAATFVTTHGDG